MFLRPYLLCDSAKTSSGPGGDGTSMAQRVRRENRPTQGRPIVSVTHRPVPSQAAQLHSRTSWAEKESGCGHLKPLPSSCFNRELRKQRLPGLSTQCCPLQGGARQPALHREGWNRRCWYSISELDLSPKDLCAYRIHLATYFIHNNKLENIVRFF